MQAVTQSPPSSEVRPAGLAVSYELIAIVLLTLLSLALRVAQLDNVPLTTHEASQVLAAWRALHPPLSGSALVPDSPLLFLLHGIALSISGGAEAAVRSFTALGGVALVLSPLLFRDVLGRGRAFLFSVILSFSPVLLLASRFDSPVIWSLLSAVLALWALRRWWRTDQAGWALAAAGLFTSVILLTDPAGWVFGLVLVGAGAAAVLWTRLDTPDDDLLPELRQRLRSWPWQRSLLAAALTVFVVGTAFMLYTPGLAAVGQLLQEGLAGLTNAQPGAPPFYGLLTALFYEPLLWVFGIAALVMLARRGELGLLDRFFAAWLMLAGAGTLIYAGTGSDHALWLTLPLTGLTTAAVLDCFQPDRHPFLDVPAWAKPVVAALMVALLAIFAINFQAMARTLLRAPDGSPLTIQPDPINTVWTIIALLFMIVGYFLVSSLWGEQAALRGVALGLLAFGLVSSLGSGWEAAVTRADDPVEFWHMQATGREAFLLRGMLTTLTQRQTGGFPYLTVYVQADDAGVMAWLLRDFVDVHYITEPGEARTQEVVLLPASEESPDLGGSYVGADFIITREWSPDRLLGFDLLPWWLQRRVRADSLPSQMMVLWLRQDIYDGVEFSPAN